MSEGEEEFALHLRAHGIPFEREYRFHPERKWRADFFIEPDILVEIEGGVFIQGRHNRGASMVADMDKYNAATIRGYRVFRFEPGKHVSTGLAVELITRALGTEET